VTSRHQFDPAAGAKAIEYETGGVLLDARLLATAHRALKCALSAL
jgi:hypothetical protein